MVISEQISKTPAMGRGGVGVAGRPRPAGMAPGYDAGGDPGGMDPYRGGMGGYDTGRRM